MRSLTLASAGLSVALSTNLPITPNVLFSEPTPIPNVQLPTHRDIPTPRHVGLPNLPLDDVNPFFDVKGDTRLFSSHSRRHVSRAILNGWAGSTVKRYSGSIKQFIRFCNAEGIPENMRFPADEFVLCAFAASSAGIHAGSTPRARLSALKAWHVAHNLQWKGSPRLRYVLNGVHNLAPRSSRRPPRPPITAKMISQLVERLDLDSPLDAAVAACATTAFWGQCRLGELLPSSFSDSLVTPFPTRSSFKRSVHSPLSCILHLPRTKTHHHGQDVVLVDQPIPSNPITLLKRQLRINNLSNDSHLFSYASSGGLTLMTKPIFLQRCNEIWHPLGYPRTTGHCFRIGGTTELLIAGIPPDIVKATGRWSSDSFLRYWRSLDRIAPQYLHHTHSKKHRTRPR
jgi:hypothetical protein